MKSNIQVAREYAEAVSTHGDRKKRLTLALKRSLQTGKLRRYQLTSMKLHYQGGCHELGIFVGDRAIRRHLSEGMMYAPPLRRHKNQCSALIGRKVGAL